MSLRKKNEIEHGKKLSGMDTEHVWGWDSVAGQLRAKRRADLIASAANLKPGVIALEIGCGTGLFTEMFARTGANLVAVDVSMDLIKKAKLRNIPKDQVEFIGKAFEDCDEEGPYNAVIGSSVLHHLDIEPALSRIKELLKPGGILSFAEPNMLNPQVFAERHFRRFFSYVSEDETAFVMHKLKNSLQKTGFKNIQITPFDWLHPSIPSPLVNPIASIGETLEKIPFLRAFAGSLFIFAQKET